MVLLTQHWAASARSASAAEAVEAKLAPDFTLETLDGETIRLSDLRRRPALINFWASWCSPWRLEMPELIRAYEAHQAEGFVILALNDTSYDSLPLVGHPASV